jgi:hypothetical protein
MGGGTAFISFLPDIRQRADDHRGDDARRVGRGRATLRLAKTITPQKSGADNRDCRRRSIAAGATTIATDSVGDK